jgi:hypothetical protein
MKIYRIYRSLGPQLAWLGGLTHLVLAEVYSCASEAGHCVVQCYG